MNAIDPSRAGKYCRPGASNLNASSFKYQKESLERLETNPLICSDRFSQATRRFCIKRGGKGQSHGKDENLKKNENSKFGARDSLKVGAEKRIVVQKKIEASLLSVSYTHLTLPTSV